MTMPLVTVRARYAAFVGQQFGDLTLLGLADRRGDGNRVYGDFRCRCGVTVQRAVARVIAGKVIDHCGCKTDHSTANKRHGMRGSAEYRSWGAMKSRCLDRGSKDYPRWGGRGVTVCPAWVASFEAFFSDMGARPPGTTLDRIDGARGYEPGNCRWATPKEQARNRTNFVMVQTPAGVMPLCDYAEKIGISNGAAHLRLSRGKFEGVARV